MYRKKFRFCCTRTAWNTKIASNKKYEIDSILFICNYINVVIYRQRSSCWNPPLDRRSRRRRNAIERNSFETTCCFITRLNAVILMLAWQPLYDVPLTSNVTRHKTRLIGKQSQLWSRTPSDKIANVSYFIAIPLCPPAPGVLSPFFLVESRSRSRSPMLHVCTW